MLIRIQQRTVPSPGLNRPLPMDVALGRGGMANNHGGNKAFRGVIAEYKTGYASTVSPVERKLMIKQVQVHLEDAGFRFVEKKNGLWFEAPAKKSRSKIAQALRERVSELRTITNVNPAPPAVPSQDITTHTTSGSSSLDRVSIDFPVEEGEPQSMTSFLTSQASGSFLSPLPMQIASDFHVIPPKAIVDKVEFEEQFVDSPGSDLLDLTPLPVNNSCGAVTEIELEEQYVDLFLECFDSLKIRS